MKLHKKGLIKSVYRVTLKYGSVFYLGDNDTGAGEYYSSEEEVDAEYLRHQPPEEPKPLPVDEGGGKGAS